MSKDEVVHIALGSNLGDRPGNLARAAELMSELVEISAASSIYETPPWGVVDQPRFLNQVIKGNTSLAPMNLLYELKAIERLMGRRETVRYGPRIIDLDILLYGDRVINYNRLQVPHPRMLERAFVLVPLAEISPGIILPNNQLPVESLLQQVDQTGIEKFTPFKGGNREL